MPRRTFSAAPQDSRTKRRSTIAAVAAIGAVILSSTGWTLDEQRLRRPRRPPQPASAPADSRPVNFEEYCKAEHGSGTRAALISNDAYGWRCERTPTNPFARTNKPVVEHLDISVADACTWNYGPWAEVGLTSPSDPNGWYCTIPASTVVEFTLDAARNYVGKVVQDKFELFLTTRHVSPKCDGPSYVVIRDDGTRVGTFNECRAWSFRREFWIGREIENIHRVVGRTAVYEGDAFLIEWWARDHDPLFDNACGIQAGGVGDPVVTPIRRAFVHEDGWGDGHHGWDPRGWAVNERFQRCKTSELVPAVLDISYTIRTGQ